MKLFVANFHDWISADDLRELFEECGEVEDVTIFRHHRTGDSLGFGFVEFTYDSDAAKAIQKLNWKNWRGQRLKVSEARKREEAS
jgi:RNA recognition motif-containing protein